MTIKALNVPIVLNEVNFICDFALLSIAEKWEARLLWALRICLSSLGLFLFFGCDPVSEEGAAVCLIASFILYMVSFKLFDKYAKPRQKVNVFKSSQVSVINFLLNLPGWAVGTVDRYTVPMLNLAAVSTITVIGLILVPLQNAWGCYLSDDISKLEYGTCPEFKDFEITHGNSGSICSRPESTINCVIRKSAFAEQYTARFVAFVFLTISLVIYFGASTSRQIYAAKLFLAQVEKSPKD